MRAGKELPILKEMKNGITACYLVIHAMNVLLVDSENFSVSATMAACDLIRPDLAVFVGDFNRRELAGWVDVNACAGEVRFVSELSSGKNSTDIALTVVAMQLVSLKISVLYLASADHDFGPLIRHVERMGIRVVQVLMNGNARPCHTDVMYVAKPDGVEDLVMTAVEKLIRPHRRGCYVRVADVVRSIANVSLSERDVVRIVRKRGGHIDSGRIYFNNRGRRHGQ